MVEGASSIKRPGNGVGDLLPSAGGDANTNIRDKTPFFYETSLSQHPMRNNTLCHNHNFVFSNKTTTFGHNYGPCHSLPECSCSSGKDCHSNNCQATEASSGLWSPGSHRHRKDLARHILHEVEATSDTSIPPPERCMEEKAVALCRSEPASHLPISAQNTRTYDCVTEGQCTGNPQVDMPYESNTRGQTWAVSEIPGARGLCGANRTSDLFTVRMQVPPDIYEGNYIESREGAAVSAMFCEPGGEWDDNLGSGHVITSGRQDDTTSAFDVQTSRILARAYQDYGPLDLDEDILDSITEDHELTAIPNHQYLYDRCNQTYIIYCREGIYEFSIDFQGRRFVGKTLEDVKTWEERRSTIPWVRALIGATTKATEDEHDSDDEAAWRLADTEDLLQAIALHQEG
ncbi:hypothetical protein L211DRAFT_901752 [Terfezia boudieri ATCC MYA-4762]|uniref:Uncharacterized protein n=1 Tax=Terfezia boudieri ATCC MYA-4762 TaxID=1051890 RepID=A0A3N4L739_9PEZI|nr:hypothetical protein L211DRAFT_901752 [Terfezia boudieri ATCC MYA-4762]